MNKIKIRSGGIPGGRHSQCKRPEAGRSVVYWKVKWDRSKEGRRQKSLSHRAWMPGKEFGFLLCVMESLQCFKQRNGMIQLAFWNDPFGCSYVEDGCERPREKRSPERRPWQQRMRDDDGWPREVEIAKGGRIQDSGCVFGHKKDKLCWLGRVWVWRVVTGREGMQGCNRKSLRSQRGQVARCSQLPFKPSASDRCC